MKNERTPRQLADCQWTVGYSSITAGHAESGGWRAVGIVVCLLGAYLLGALT